MPEFVLDEAVGDLPLVCDRLEDSETVKSASGYVKYLKHGLRLSGHSNGAPDMVPERDSGSTDRSLSDLTNTQKSAKDKLHDLKRELKRYKH